MSNPQTTITSTSTITRAELGVSLPNKNNQTSTIHLMQTRSPTRPHHSESPVCEQTPGQPETGRSFPADPMITITEIALKKIVEFKERLEAPVKGIRVRAIPRSPLRASFSLSFVPDEEPESPTDSIHSCDGINLYIDPDSAPYLEGATIDFVLRIIGSGLRVGAPLRKLDTPEGRIAAKVQQVIDEKINPSLAMHGGGAILIDYKAGTAYVELAGGCQGCSMADATLKNSIVTSIQERVPEVQEVLDVTEHANGRNPYFQQ